MDPISLQRANQLFPELALLWNKFHDTLIGQYGNEPRITQGLRTSAEQDALFAKVPKVTNARGGYSMHNFGLAFDACPDKIDGGVWTPDWDGKDAHYAMMVSVGEDLGLNCGADWHSFKDEPHFQWARGLPNTPTDQMRADLAGGGLNRVWENVRAGKYNVSG